MWFSVYENLKSDDTFYIGDIIINKIIYIMHALTILSRYILPLECTHGL